MNKLRHLLVGLGSVGDDYSDYTTHDMYMCVFKYVFAMLHLCIFHFP